MPAPYADLHLHTHYSDGTWEPAALVQRAADLGFSAIAVTDHDTLESAPDVAAAAREHDLEIIPGLELSTAQNGQDVHLLAYGFDARHVGLRAWLTQLQAQRRARLDAMITRLQQLGVEIAVGDVLRLAGPGTVGRLHVARALVACGAIQQTNEAFHKYIGTGQPAFVAEHHPTPHEAIQHVRAAGGVPVLAHPGFLSDEASIPEWIEAGLRGLEVYHSGHGKKEQARFRAMAETHELVMTGGSDCHGTAKGKPLIGSVWLPYTYVEQLNACRVQTFTS